MNTVPVSNLWVCSGYCGGIFTDDTSPSLETADGSFYCSDCFQGVPCLNSSLEGLSLSALPSVLFRGNHGSK